MSLFECKSASEIKDYFIRLLESPMNFEKSVMKITKAFKKFNVDYMLIGRGSAIIQGFDEVTLDVDIYPANNKENNQNILKALKYLKFTITPNLIKQVIKGKDFIGLTENGLDLDIVFYPDGFHNYSSALKYKTIKDGIPLLNIKGIIKSKKSANRAKDKASIPSLLDFDKMLNNECMNKQNIQEVRWDRNIHLSLRDRLLRHTRPTRWNKN